MTSSQRLDNRTESPDPAGHAVNIYDASTPEDEWLDETDDDDMDFEATTDESEDAEFFDPSEDLEVEFHGALLRCRSSRRRLVLAAV